jgi:hypothetical protein
LLLLLPILPPAWQQQKHQRQGILLLLLLLLHPLAPSLLLRLPPYQHLHLAWKQQHPLLMLMLSVPCCPH